MDIKHYVGMRIKEARQSKNRTLKEVGDAINYDFSSLSKIERGEYEASYSVLKQIADFLNVKVGDFFGEETPIPKELEGLNIEELRIAKELQEHELTKEELEQINNFIQFMLNQKRK